MNIINAFVQEWTLCAGAKSVLHVKGSAFNFFTNIHNLNTQEVDASQSVPKNSLYDLILGDLPFGRNLVEWVYGAKTIKAQQNWLEILKSLGFLETNGTALFLLEPLGFSTSMGVTFEKILVDHGFFVNAYINCPKRILHPETAITPILVALSRQRTKKLFVAEISDDTQARVVVRNYFSNINEGDLARGKFIGAGDYSGFHHIKIREQIDRLETQYKTYEEYSLGDLAIEINYARPGEQLHERDNAIYISRIGCFHVIYRLEDANLKHHHYFQVVLRDSVLNKYVVSFFGSALGKLVIDSLTTSSTIDHRNKKDIEQALIALPGLEEQRSIVQTQNKLQVLKNAIDGFHSELALNPTSSSSILDQLDKMLTAINALTDADRVRGFVREGETKYVEFKETLGFDVKKQTKENYLVDSALKTVVGFLNTDGGKLLVGVSNDGQIPGLGVEIGKIHKNLDTFLLYWKNFLKNRIGVEYYPFIESRVIKVGDKPVLFVECKSSRSGCFLDKKDYYVRTNPATDRLEGPKLVEYVRNREANWKN